MHLHSNFIMVCFAHDDLMVDWSERWRLQREKHELKTPQASLLDEEAEATPAESVRLERKSTALIKKRSCP